MDIRTAEKTIYFPMLVPASGRNEVMSREENQAVWKKFYTISPNIQDIVTDEQMPKKVAELQIKYQLSDDFIGMISLSVRKIFFGEMSLADAETNLKNILVSQGDDGNKASAIVQFIEKEIMTLKPKARAEEQEEVKSRSQSVTARMPLLQALSKYEQLGNQLITSERIRVKSQSEPVRPSLLYWIKYYRDELGIGHHDTVQRGDFLFRSENGKHLSAEERERVNLVLKSVEENFPLEIDTERSEIVFPFFETPSPALPTPPPAPRINASPVFAAATVADKMRPVANPAFSFGRSSMAPAAPQTPARPVSISALSTAPSQAAPGGEMSFSSKHVFPAEKDAEASKRQASSVPASPQRVAAPQGVPKSNPFRIHPVSLGEPDKTRTI